MTLTNEGIACIFRSPRPMFQAQDVLEGQDMLPSVLFACRWDNELGSWWLLVAAHDFFFPSR